jgi:hypothetical protein
MRKLLLMAAMLALVALVAAPVLAQSFDFDDDDDFDNDFDNNDDRVFFFDDDNNNDDDFFFDGGGGGVSSEFEQETDETGDVSLDTTVTGSGDNSNQCVAPLQFGNTGNLQNAQGFLQYDSSADDVEFEGSEFVFAPEQSVVCGQSVEQAAAASN